ncbi:hypothetical protein PLICRDRAFT_87598 [Plicaturopsis crispa FD-325 SS-3]|nr:hypothetical protein PLICRDRAFT_87598 [Plicaturopsis crispa FD-325 SS-3]
MVFSVMLAPALDHVKRLSSSNVYDRRDNPFAPDFCLVVRRAQPWRVVEIDFSTTPALKRPPSSAWLICLRGSLAAGCDGRTPLVKLPPVLDVVFDAETPIDSTYSGILFISRNSWRSTCRPLHHCINTMATGY